MDVVPYKEQLMGPYYANVLRRFVDFIERDCLNESNGATIREKLGTIKTIMHSEPYKSVPEGVDVQKLTMYHKVVFFALSMKRPELVYLFHALKMSVKKLQEKLKRWSRVSVKESCTDCCF